MLRSKKFSLKNKKSQQKRSFYISNRVKLMIFISFVVGKIEWARRNQLNLFLWLLNFFLRLKLGWFSGDVHMQRNIGFFFCFPGYYFHIIFTLTCATSNPALLLNLFYSIVIISSITNIIYYYNYYHLLFVFIKLFLAIKLYSLPYYYHHFDNWNFMNLFSFDNFLQLYYTSLITISCVIPHLLLYSINKHSYYFHHLLKLFLDN